MSYFFHDAFCVLLCFYLVSSRHDVSRDDISLVSDDDAVETRRDGAVDVVECIRGARFEANCHRTERIDWLTD